MSEHQITVERPWANIPTKQLVNTETGQTEIFILNALGNEKVAESGENNVWVITDKQKLLNRYNQQNPTKILPNTKELDKVFFTSGTKQFNSDRADVINKNSTDNDKTRFATKVNPVPGVKDPKTGIIAGQTAPQAGIPPATDPQAAATEGDTEATTDDFQKIANAAKSYKGRKKYPEDLRYPENMNKNQDCIQFKIIEYIPSKLGLSGSEDIKLRTTFGTRSPLSTITLPMPSGGISDRNSVNWGSQELNVAKDALANVAMNLILGGPGAGADATKKEFTKATAGNKDLLKAIIAAKASETAVSTNNLLSRAFGVELNPNLELLFNSPELREFSFSFKMTPRSKKEAQIVRSIIRTFKQAMSVKRSQSVLLLKAPHTFRISYLTSTAPHPYLNRFKECALTNCSVNYTPDGQYMSYDDSSPDGRSMTAYELSLSFNELEPIFDDDYDDGKDGASGPFTNIGY